MYKNIWVKNNSPVDYLQTSQANRDPWRWRKPHSKLRIPYNVVDRPGVTDAHNVSSFVFRPQFRFADFISPFSGIALISFDLLLIFSSTVSAADFLPAFAIYLCLFCLGLFFLQYGDRVLRIDLYPERVEIITKFANFIPRTTTYRRHQLFSINGKLQSFWTMESGQIQPDYKLIIERSLLGYFQVNQTFRLRCDPTQGSWIVGGLDHWKSLCFSAAEHS
ncbi:MAG: hypothetical protein VKL59_25265 [Nostocaceae cyanobacterium]|nr:hypothetical protein [Nostocaceae cyanobacterium]